MYVADDKITFNLQGIIYIAKKDKKYLVEGVTLYVLELQYKTAAKVIEYETEEARNAIYDLAIEKILATKVKLQS